MCVQGVYPLCTLTGCGHVCNVPIGARSVLVMGWGSVAGLRKGVSAKTPPSTLLAEGLGPSLRLLRLLVLLLTTFCRSKFMSLGIPGKTLV